MATKEEPVTSFITKLMTSFSESVKWHSSPVDWCEPNYATTSYVVEFYNATTNIIFLVLPAILMVLFHPFGKRVSQRVQIMWVFMAAVGLSSAYFHGTLTLSGQLLDEYGIVWMFSACMAFWYPRTRLPKFLAINRFDLLMLIFAVVVTILGIVAPFFNSFLMMCFSIPLVVLLIRAFQPPIEKEAKLVAIQAMVLWLVAAAVWLLDRFACESWLRRGIPGLHWLWHLISAVCCYRVIIFFVYRDACRKHRDLKPTLTCWPTNRFGLLVGILYIKLGSPLPLSQEQSRHLSNDSKYNNVTTTFTKTTSEHYYKRGRHGRKATS